MPSDTATRKFAEAAIDAHAMEEDLFHSAANPDRVTFTEIFAFVQTPGPFDKEDFWNRLQRDPMARSNLHAVLERTAIFHLPKQAAAASEYVNRREVRGVSAALIPSRAEPSQVYMAIEIVDRSLDLPKQMFLRTENGVLRLRLPEFVAGRAQLLLDTADPVTVAFENPATEIFLR